MFGLLVAVAYMTFWLSFGYFVRYVLNVPLKESQVQKVVNFQFSVGILVVTIYAIFNWI